MRYPRLVALAVMVAALGGVQALAQGGASLPPPGSPRPPTPAGPPPGNPKIDLAIAAFGAGDFARACEWCEEAMTEQPACEPEARIALAQLYASRGDFGKAKEQAALAFSKARELECPSLADAKARIALVGQQSADLEELLAREQPSEDATPEELADSYLGMVHALVRYGQLDQASEGCTRIIADFPQSPEAADAGRILAAIYTAQGQPERARAVRPATRGGQWRVGGATGVDYAALQEHLAAKLEIVRKAKTGSEEAARARYEMGCWYAAYDQDEDAVKTLTSLIKEQPYSPYASRAFGVLQLLYAAAGRQAEMMTALPPLVEGTKSTGLWWRLGRMYEAMGEDQKAWVAYEKAGGTKRHAPPKPSGSTG